MIDSGPQPVEGDSPAPALTQRVRAALAKPLLPVVFFFAGVTYDTVTLTRIDRLLDNLLLLLYLSALGCLVVLQCRAEAGTTLSLTSGAGGLTSLVSRGRPYFPMAIQFLLGSLFSAYTIFYSQSASFTTTAVFFGVLVALLVANEFLRHRFSNATLLVSLYAVVAFSFLTFFLPVMTGVMHTAVFLLGAALALAVTWGMIQLIYRPSLPESRAQMRRTQLAGASVIGVLVLFYALNWIPPVPLSLKFGGVYHGLTKYDGAYELRFERGAWYQPYKRADDRFHGSGPAYCFTAVFAPVDLNTTIYHRWQYRPSGGGKPTARMMTTDRIPIAIAGGREGGYRGYTVKQQVVPGEWLVDVETADGRVIGRVRFRVAATETEEREWKTIRY